MSEQPKRLYRSRTNRVLAGVCGGIGEYLNVDPTVVRVACILLTILPFVPGIILYVIAWIVIPKRPSQTVSESTSHSVSGAASVGIFFIVLGGLFLLSNLHIFHWRDWWDVSWEYGAPLLLIAAGVLLVLRPSRRTTEDTPPQGGPPAEGKPRVDRKVLRRSLTDRKLFGVCGGLASYFDIDVSIVRIAFVFFSLWPFGLGIVAYVVMLLIIPEEQMQPQTES